MIHTQFFIELGKALYALAFADGTVHEAEVKKLEHKVKKILMQLNSEQEVDKAVILAKLRFRYCLDNNIKPAAAMHSFKEFMKKDGRRIDQHHLDTAKSLLHAVANSYKGIEKSELKTLNQLDHLLMKTAL